MVLPILLLAALALPARAEDASGRVWVAPDFFVETGLSALNVQSPSPASGDCRAGIAAKVCLAPGYAGPGKLPDMHCLPGAEPYAKALERLYDEYPPVLRAAFCDLKVIYVLQKLESSAYGGYGNGGGQIAVRQSILDQGLSLPRWASWKEQLPFGGAPGSYDARPDLPEVDAAVPGSSNDGLFYIFAHEFGHILDFKNGLNSSGWGAISWLSYRETRHDAVFPLRLKLDFYGAGPKFDRSQVAAVYEQFLLTDFISLYAATNPYDDFAETFALRVLGERGGDFVVRTNSQPGISLRPLDRLASPQLQTKREFIEKFLSQPLPSAAPAPTAPGLPKILSSPDSIRWN